MRTYLDYNATAPIHPQAQAALQEALQLHNASAIYQEGRTARAAIEIARAQIINLCGGGEVVFTSGGTEACNLVFNIYTDEKPARIIVSASEHAAVLQTAQAQNIPCAILPITTTGIIDMQALEKLLEDPTPALICVQAANNETGVLQPIADIAALAHTHNSLLFCDAVQAAGKINIDINEWQCDALALSAHKIGGAMGTGALVMREGLRLAPHITGGGQELGLRAGTENTAGIVAFGIAAELATQHQKTQTKQWQEWRDDMANALRTHAPSITIFGEDAPRLPNTLCFGLAGFSAETLLMKLDLAGFAISSGAACSSGKVERSHVLAAMGVEETLAASALRVSFGWQTKQAELTDFIQTFHTFIAQQKAA